jgi:transposase
MPPAEVDSIKQDLADVKREVRDSLNGMRSDVKELAKALHELIRLDGDLGRVADLTNRIGKQVDEIAAMWRSEKAEIDRRLRLLETAQALNTQSASLFDWLVRNALTIMVSGVIGAAVVMKVT